MTYTVAIRKKSVGGKKIPVVKQACVLDVKSLN